MVSKTLDFMQKRPLIAEIWETNKISNIIALAYCFESLSKQQSNTEEMKFSLADTLN